MIGYWIRCVFGCGIKFFFVNGVLEEWAGGVFGSEPRWMGPQTRFVSLIVVEICIDISDIFLLDFFLL